MVRQRYRPEGAGLVKILAAYDGAGCGHVRLIQPLRELARHGHEVTFIHYEKATETLRNAKDYDVIIGQRFAGYDGMALWRRSRLPSNRLVYETDDDLFNLDKSNWAAYQQFNQPKIREAIKGYCELADLVTVTTRTLGELHVEHGARKVAILPNCIPEYVLELPRQQHDRPRIGWIGGSSHGVDVLQAVPAVRRFMKHHGDWGLFLGGTDYRPTFDLSDWSRMIFAEWKQINDDERAYYEMIDFDIGIAPVRETPFNKSKSAIKALEYNARGIPVVASDVQPYREYIKHGYNGFLVKDEQEWSHYLRLLADEPDLRNLMGANGRLTAQKWTVEENWKLWEQAYTDLFGVKQRDSDSGPRVEADL